MVNQVLNHPAMPATVAFGFITGAGLFLGGLLMGHNVATMASLMAAGAGVGALSLAATAIKADLYFKTKRLKETEDQPATAVYVPASTNHEDWEQMRQKNPGIRIAEVFIIGNDPAVRRSTTLDDLERWNGAKTGVYGVDADKYL